MYIILGRSQCNFCDSAKAVLYAKGEPYTYIDILKEENKEILNWIKDNNLKTVPQIFKLVGTYDDLVKEIKND